MCRVSVPMMGDGARFEELLSDLSTRFSGVPSHRVDAEIDRALERLVELLHTDRSSLAELGPDGRSITVSALVRPIGSE